MSKPIFNSLGSNYDWQDTWLALAPGGKQEVVSELERQIGERFDGRVVLTYKGRDAITLALQALKVGKADAVITQAFTCCAVEAGIQRSGAEVVFADVAKGKLNPGVSELETAFLRSRNPVKAVFVQHTLGFPAEVEQIKQWCQKKNLLLIEDLAQAVGGTSEDGKVLGSLGDAVVLSFGRDKIVDSVSGGAVVWRDDQTELSPLSYPPLMQEWHDRLYPLIAKKIQATYSMGVGKVIHRLAVKSGFISSPAGSPLPSPALFPPGLSRLALKQWSQTEKSIKHRRKMALEYDRLLPETVKIVNQDDIKAGAVVRYPILVHNPDLLANKMASKGIFISDRWYRRAVDCGKVSFASRYQEGACPKAESLAADVLTLPVHRGITVNEVERISEEIKKWH